MKIVAIGDIQGRSVWKLIVEQEKDADKVVFIGDYFDSRDVFTAEEQMQNFKEIVHYKKDHPEKEVILLIGNHDHQYLQCVKEHNTSGYQKLAAPAIQQLIEENVDQLQMCYRHEDLLFSHAGIGHSWLKDHGWKEEQDISSFVNDQFKYKPLSFCFFGFDPYGDDTIQTPIWIRPRSLLRDCHDTLRKQYIQIVGHTGMTKIDVDGKATGGRYFFIDTLGTSGEYLKWEDGIFSVGKTK